VRVNVINSRELKLFNSTIVYKITTHVVQINVFQPHQHINQKPLLPLLICYSLTNGMSNLIDDNELGFLSHKVLWFRSSV